MKEQKEIKIQVPDGYEIDTQLSTFERIVFKEVKKELTYEDIETQLLKKANRLVSVARCYLFSIPTEQTDSIIALNKLCNVAKYLNGTWLPERNRGSYIKWFISINYESLGGPESTLTIGKHNTVQYSIVYFKTKELAQQAIDILGEEEIRKALTLNH